MGRWKRLDLRAKDQRPAAGELVALRLAPNNSRATFYKSERFEIGRFEFDRDGKKLWWRHSRGADDPIGLKRHYDIWWCRVPPYDGY